MQQLNDEKPNRREQALNPSQTIDYNFQKLNDNSTLSKKYNDGTSLDAGL